MKPVSMRALFGVSVTLGILLGLEFHIDRTPSAQAYASYLSQSEALNAALARTAVLTAALAADDAQLRALEEVSVHAKVGLVDLRQELAKLRKQAGMTTVAGPGVRISIAFDPKLPIIPGLSYVDEATQLQIVVNALQAGGAQAIAINGQRLVTTSSIRSVHGLSANAGPFSGVVQVNGQPVLAPYEIEAVGSPGRLVTILTAEALGQQFNILEQSFTVSQFRKTPITLPAYSGPLPGQYSTEVGI